MDTTGLDDDDNKPVKVVLLGESGVGKSSLAVRFVMDEFRPYSEATIGASFLSKTIQVSDDGDGDSRKIAFKIWDTAGQEKYHSLAAMYYRGAAAAIVVYDICNRVSFETLKSWITEVKANGPSNIVLAVCGNKFDLVLDRQVSYAEGMEYASSVGAVYMETSARDDKNVAELFREVGKRVPVEKPTGRDGVVDLSAAGQASPTSSCC